MEGLLKFLFLVTVDGQILMNHTLTLSELRLLFITNTLWNKFPPSEVFE